MLKKMILALVVLGVLAGGGGVAWFKFMRPVDPFGAAKAAARGAEREASNGLVAAQDGALVELRAETDFVAKNEDFLGFAKKAAELVAAKNPADVAALSALPLDGSSVEAVRTALVGKIGENVSLRRFACVAAVGKLATYIHGGAKVGVLIDIAGGDDALAKDIAMHIAAIKPMALSKEGIPADLIKRERDIGR